MPPSHQNSLPNTQVSSHGVVFWWAILALIGVLAQAVIKLTPLAIEAIDDGLNTAQWAILISWTLFNAWAEGIRGFHQMVAPRAVARAEAAAQRPTLLRVLLAPFFLLCFFDATKKRLIVAWCVWLAIIGLIVGVRSLSQPWRGIVDTGVVVGLAIGAISILYFALRATLGHSPQADPELAPRE